MAPSGYAEGPGGSGEVTLGVGTAVQAKEVLMM